MNFLLNSWLGDWLAGLGRIAVMAREALGALLTFRVVGRDLLRQIHILHG